MIDEINCCQSLTLEKGIVEYFSKTEDTKGQLIFTTHEEQRIHERRGTYTNALTLTMTVGICYAVSISKIHLQERCKMEMLYAISDAATDPLIETDHIFGIVVADSQEVAKLALAGCVIGQ